MKIIKYKKLSKGKYKITFDTNEIILYEDVIIKNQLLLTKNISIKTLEKVIEENKYYEVYNLSLSYIETRMRSEKELKEYLMKKTFEESLIDNVIEHLKNEGYINEQKYIESFINDKFNLTKDGPYKIKRSLIDMEMNEDLIDNYLNTFSYNDWKEKLSKIIDKRVNLMKNKSLSVIKNKLKIEAFNLGYQNDLIEEILNNINKKDDDSLEKEYIKAYKKYNKNNKEKLDYNIRNYLYRKGFNISDINQIIESKKNKD